jgi:hypothetical protein
MNTRQWLVLGTGIILFRLTSLTLLGSSELFTTVNGRTVVLYDSSFAPDGLKWLALLCLLALTATGLYFFRSAKRTAACLQESSEKEGEWPPPPNMP